MSEGLKPCPFCGGKAHVAREADPHHGDYFKVACRDCNAQSREKWAAETCPIFYEEVREIWNTRAAIDTTEADALREAGDDVIRASNTLMLMLVGDLAVTKSSLEAAIRRTLDARNAWDNVARAQAPDAERGE